MTVGNVQSTVESSNYAYSAKRTAGTTAEYGDIRDTLEMRTGRTESGIIGLTMIPGDTNACYGAYAKYAEESTAENPVIQVVSDYGGHKIIYNVNINDVDPSNATMLEMFALLSYADDQGLTDAGTFGSFQQLKVYAENAGQNGYFDEISGWDDFVNKKLDWTNALENIGQDYLETGLYQQYQSCQKLLRFLHDKIEEMQAKIEAGDVDNEPAIQIGGRAYTQEEWNKLLEQVDEAEEEIQKAMEVEQEKRAEETTKAEALEKAEETQEVPETEEPTAIENAESILVTAESTKCTYKTDDPEDDDLTYVTWFTEEGMFCKELGGDVGNNWAFFWENDEQYAKVMEFINQFPDDYNMRFACNETFWNDFLNDEIDMDAFMDFLETTDNGVPDYMIETDNAAYIDREKMAWTKYMNPPGWIKVLSKEDLLAWNTEDPKYTDPATGFSWHVGSDGKPYMTYDEKQRFYEYCEEMGISPAKKFAEMTGMLQYLGDGSYAYIGSNGISVKSADGEKLIVAIEDMSYDMLMELFRNFPETDNYFNQNYWEENIKNVKEVWSI